MASFPTLRGTPRIFELGRATWVDLPFMLEEFPETLQPELLVQRAQDGSLETMPGTMWGRWHVRMGAMDAKTRAMWKLVFDRTLSKGQLVEFIRDSLRGFWLSGDTDRDELAGFAPAAGSSYSLMPGRGGDFVGTQTLPGALSVDPVDPSPLTRTNLLPNGDGLDGSAGWVIDTPSTLALSVGTYLRPFGEACKVFEFSALGAGSKVAHIDFTLAGATAATLPGDLLTLSMATISTKHPSIVIAGSTVTIALFVPSDSTVLAWDAFTPAEYWVRYHKKLSTASLTQADTTLRLRLTFHDNLAQQRVSLTELQIEGRAFYTAFTPYSVTRGLSGSRTTAGLLVFLNVLWYRHQLPTRATGGRWGFVIAFAFTPHWDSADIPSATVTLYADADTASVGNLSALRIHATSNTIVATATLADGAGTTVTATQTGWAWGIGQKVHILATFQDSNNFASNTGSLDLWVDGSLAQHSTHSNMGLRQGEFSWWGTRQDGTQRACGDFAQMAQDPVYVDQSNYFVAEYLQATNAPLRPDRNSVRCVLDSGQRGRSDRVTDNTVPLEVTLLEHVS